MTIGELERYTPAEERLLTIVERGLQSSPAQIPSGFVEGNSPPSIGVPVNGDEYRQKCISKLCTYGDLNCVRIAEGGRMVFLTNRMIPSNQRVRLPWETAEKEKQMATAAAKKVEKVEKPKKEKVEKPMVPCACGCGEMAKKAFAMHHDGKLASLMKRIGRHEEKGAEAKSIVKTAFKNPHVAGSAFFQKLHVEMEEGLRNPPPPKEKKVAKKKAAEAEVEDTDEETDE